MKSFHVRPIWNCSSRFVQYLQDWLLQILNEPTAAAVDMTGKLFIGRWGEQRHLWFRRRRTFEVVVLNINKHKIRVKEVRGDIHLGGEDFHNRMVSHFVYSCKYWTNRIEQTNFRCCCALFTSQPTICISRTNCNHRFVYLTTEVLLEDFFHLCNTIDRNYSPS